MNLFTLDVGQGKFHAYDSGNDIFYGKLPEQDLINLSIPGLKKGDSIVIECAHVRESHRYTLAQPFNFDQLTQLKENAKEKGITIRLFPQKSTPKTRKLAGVEASDKTDEVDTKAIAHFLLKDRSAFYALKEFVPTRLTDFQEKNNSVFDYIKQCNEEYTLPLLGHALSELLFFQLFAARSWLIEMQKQQLQELYDELSLLVLRSEI